jgi:DNA-directed RNA polymerase beta subunit
VIPCCACWWQNHFGVMVSQIDTIPSGGLRIFALHERSPVNGDKFTASHGQRGAVTVLDDCFMPSTNGGTADIVTGSSSAIRRQTASQLLEAACGQCCVENMETTGCVACESTDHHCSQNHRIRRSFAFSQCSSSPAGCTNA